MTSTFLYDLCLPVTIYLESESFQADTGWIVGAFFLGLLVGGGITAILAPICMRDWQKKKVCVFDNYPFKLTGFQIRECIGKLFSLCLIQNICCGYSKNVSMRQFF